MKFSGHFTVCFVGGDEGSDSDGTTVGKEFGYFADTPDVFSAVSVGETCRGYINEVLYMHQSTRVLANTN